MKHLGTRKIETNRLVLRKLRKDDAFDMFDNWCNDGEVTKFLSWFPHGKIEVTFEILDKWISSYSSNKFYLYGIEFKENHELIGTINGFNVNKNSIEIGYCIAKKYWNKGFTTEALNEVTKYFIDQCEIETVYAKHI